MSMLWKRVAALFHKGRLDGELEEEIANHLAMQEAEFRAGGMNAAEARLAARREFGGVTQTVEAYRERRGVAWVENSLKDLRYAVRGLARNPGFTAAAVLSLALGIGANTAIFSLVRNLMLRMLPVRHPEQLVYLYRTGGWSGGFVSYPLYLDLAKRDDVFEGVAARSGVGRARFSRPESARVEFAQMEYVSGNYFGLLGVKPAIGRLIGESDNRTPKGHPLAVLSYEFWRNRFGGDAAVLGTILMVDGQPLTVVGVAAAGFRGVEVEHHPDLWAPCMMYDGNIMSPGMNWVWAVGRRRAGISRERIQAVVDTVMQQNLVQRYGKNSDAAFRRSAFAQRLGVYGADAGISSLRFLFGKALLVLMAAVGLVLMAACANLANLLLARGGAVFLDGAARRAAAGVHGPSSGVALGDSGGASRTRRIGRSAGPGTCDVRFHGRGVARGRNGGRAGARAPGGANGPDDHAASGVGSYERVDAVNAAALFLTNSCTVSGRCPVRVRTSSDKRS